MNARDLVFASIRSALAVTGQEAPRRKEVEDRLQGHPTGVVPERGQLAEADRLRLFAAMVEAASGSVETVSTRDDVPSAVGAFLRNHNLPLAVRRGDDPTLAALRWDREPALEVSVGASDGQQRTSVSCAMAGVAETGTLVLTSGPENPTTLNFLPDNHIVVLDAEDVAGDFERVFQCLREKFGPGVLPRAVNLITGPSRSADIEQTLILGAHGPRRLHVILVAPSTSGA